MELDEHTVTDRFAGLPYFNWSEPIGREGAAEAINAEEPFVLHSVADFERAAILAEQDSYLARILGNTKRRVDLSHQGPLLRYYKSDLAKIT